MSPLHQKMVTGSGGPTASQDSWKGALGGTARSFGSTVKNGTPREKKGVLAQPPLSFLPLKSQVHFHLNYSVRPAPQDPREGVSRKQARGVGRGAAWPLFSPSSFLAATAPTVPSQTCSDSPSQNTGEAGVGRWGEEHPGRGSGWEL